jgi:metallo-beta-lactamase family protein
MNLNASVPPGKPPKVTFYGAAQAVSGSMHLLECGKYRFLFDCGLFRGPRQESRRRNAKFSFDPSTIDAVFLSHAHVDHCGNLPNLVRQGFTGPIYCTHATLDLIEVMLEDSARIHESENAMMANFRSPRMVQNELFDYEDVDRAIEACVAVNYLERVNVTPDAQIRFINAGHILGSAMIEFTARIDGQEYSIVFTGDLGRRGVPYVAEPSAVPAADLIICESTYGGKTHDSLEVMTAKMSTIVARTFERGGKVLIPAFSLGRTHLVLYYLRLWMAKRLLPRMPIYVDSPLAQRIDTVFQKHKDSLSPDIEAIPCEWLESEEDTLHTSTQPEPCIIVASGGMCEGGKIVPHLKHHIDDPRSTIVLVSYQAPDSMGAQLLSPVPTVRFHGKTWNKWIEVAEVKGFSGHADQNDFEWLLGGAVSGTSHVRLVHGEPQQLLALEKQLTEMGFADVRAPKRMESVALRSIALF